jgi:PIN domain nuclease of toxin-antitoxin system
MSLLLDTHIVYWAITRPQRLSVVHRDRLADRRQAVHVSAVTGWEIAIKVKLRKWPEAAALLPDLDGTVRAAGFAVLPITLAEAEGAGSLDLVHRDPFDRLLAAQALTRDLTVATVDPAFAGFGCRVV